MKIAGSLDSTAYFFVSAAFALLSASGMAPTEFYVKRLSDRAKLPVRGSTLAAGWDLASAESVVVPAKGKALVKTNLAIAIPEDCYARIAPRK